MLGKSHYVLLVIAMTVCLGVALSTEIVKASAKAQNVESSQVEDSNPDPEEEENDDQYDTPTETLTETLTPTETAASVPTSIPTIISTRIPTTIPVPTATPEPPVVLTLAELPNLRLHFAPNEQAHTGSFVLSVELLPATPPGSHFELWLQNGSGDFLAMGPINLEEGEDVVTGDTDQELLGDYDSALLSVEADGAAMPAPQQAIYSGTIPSELLTPLRALYVGSPFTGAGAMVGAEEQAQTARIHSSFLMDALTNNDITESRRYAEHVLNVLEGATGELYGDLNRDGRIQNPGDGHGLGVYLSELEEQVKELNEIVSDLPASTEYSALAGKMLENAATAQNLLTQATVQTFEIFAADTDEDAQPMAVELLTTVQELEEVTEALFETGLEIGAIELVAIAPVSDSVPTAIGATEEEPKVVEATQPLTATDSVTSTIVQTGTDDAPEEDATSTAEIDESDEISRALPMLSDEVYWVNPVDGAEYVYVPAGEFEMGADDGENAPEIEQPLHTATTVAFWLQRTEVTNEQYGRCVAEGECTPPNKEGWDDPAFANYPVTFVDWEQAQSYAAWVGGRLPTEAEWEKSCRSDDARIFPWGDDPATEELANFGNLIGSPTDVGSYPAGASPYDVLDISGNVWEWTSSLEVTYPYFPDDGREDPDAEGQRAARGGSFYYTQYQLHCSSRLGVQPDAANDQIGFRVLMAVDEVYWVNPVDGAEYVYVPAGEFEMGADDGENAPEIEQPLHTATTVAFWLQRTEVTNEQYGRCVAEGECTPPNKEGWDDPAFANYPVTFVDWEQAQSYAAWVGGRLPTEAEWEKSCRSDDARIFPWGDDPATEELANFGNLIGSPTDVGSYPAGASPYDVLDISGNVWEWTSSLEVTYPYFPDDGREDPDAEGQRAARGGSFYYTQYQLHCSSRLGVQPDAANDQIGFRTLYVP